MRNPEQFFTVPKGELAEQYRALTPEEETALGVEQPREVEDSPESFDRADLTEAEAREVLGRDVFGPEQVQKTFGVRPKEVPSIPFSKAELERAKELNQMLILRADKTEEDKPLSLEAINQALESRFQKEGKGGVLNTAEGWKDSLMGEDYFKKESSRAGWALVSKDFVPDSTDKNYVEQTEVLIDHIKTKVFKGRSLPVLYKEAIREFESKKSTLTDLMSSDWKEASKQLSELKITQLTRQTAVETVYDSMARYDTIGERPLSDRYTWTASRSQGGALVSVGRFDVEGVDGGSWGPRGRGGGLGVSFSRSV